MTELVLKSGTTTMKLDIISWDINALGVYVIYRQGNGATRFRIPLSSLEGLKIRAYNGYGARVHE